MEKPITSDDILAKIPDMDAASAKEMAAELNLHIVEYGLDRDAVIDLLGKDPSELQKRIIKLEDEQRQAKIRLQQYK